MVIMRRIFSIFIVLAIAAVGLAYPAMASDSQPPAKGLIVKKTVKTDFTRTWKWEVSKKADRPSMSLKIGESASVNFGVVVRARSIDSDWQMSGTISVRNPTDLTATITDVTDVAGGVVAAVTCYQGNSVISFPYNLPAGWSIVCRYSADLPDGSSRTNVAKVSTVGDVQGGGDAVGVSFGSPSEEIDECVDVHDQHAGFLGTVCRGNQAFHYAWDVGPYDVCGATKFANAAKITTNDTDTRKVDVAKIDVTVVCDDGDGKNDQEAKTTEKSDEGTVDNTVEVTAETTLASNEAAVVETTAEDAVKNTSGDPSEDELE